MRGRKASLSKWQGTHLRNFVGRPGDALQVDLLNNLSARGYRYMLNNDQADFAITQLVQGSPGKQFCIIADDWDLIAFPSTDNYKLLSPKRSKPWTLKKVDCLKQLEKLGHSNLFEIYCASGSDCIENHVKSVGWKAAATIFKNKEPNISGLSKKQRKEFRVCHQEILALRTRIGKLPLFPYPSISVVILLF